MLGYSAKRYGHGGLTLRKHRDSPRPATEHFVRKPRTIFCFSFSFFLMLEALDPDSSWKPQLSWRWVLCSSRSTWKNSGWLIHNSSGVPGNVRTGAGSLALLQGRGLLPRQDVGSHQPSSTQVTSQPPGSPRGHPTTSERDWSPCSSTGQGSIALGDLTTCASWRCCCGEGSVRELAPYSGVTRATIWGIHPRLFSIRIFIPVCVWRKLCFEWLCSCRTTSCWAVFPRAPGEGLVRCC